MSRNPPSLLEKVDVFRLLDSGAPSSDDDGSQHVTEQQYAALVQMVAASLGLSAEEAERLFPSHQVQSSASSGDANSDGAAAAPPPLCAHLSREGAAYYWASPSANTIPDVRCCDARDVSAHEPFPSTGHGPHVHCLFCFHNAVASAPPAGRGVPPPVVADYRDGETLQAHQQAHHDRYLTYLRLLDDSCEPNNSSSSGGSGMDLLSDEGRAACELAAQQEGQHGCYLASIGTAACPVTTFYCADCDAFAPLARFTGTGAPDTWTSTEEVNVLLSRLLLSCHLLYMLDPSRGTKRSSAGSGSSSAAVVVRPPRHVIFLFRPILFHEGVSEDFIEEFEEGSECTHVAVVLPDASVTGSPPELLLLTEHTADAGREGSLTSGTATVAASAVAAASVAATNSMYTPVVVGFAMEWASDELLQSKLQLVQRQHTMNSNTDAATTEVPRFQISTRMVYIEDTEEWVMAHVPYHQSVATRAELPTMYEDVAEDGIRVVASYRIDAPVPTRRTENAAGVEPAAVADSDDSTSTADVEDRKEEEEEDPLALDGCPYSMESRTVDFFARMTALAKAMHELAAWRSSIDENKETFP